MSSANLLQVRSLQEWPDPPKWMTYSTATQVEACPRQWALQRGDFPEVWDGFGYPPQINLPILRGRVVHRSVETILNAFRRKESSVSPEAVLDELGGYTAVVEKEIDKVLEDKVFSNPRTQGQAADLGSDLRESASGLRAKVQRHITRLDKIPTPEGKGTSVQSVAEEKEFEASKGEPLSNGVYAEKWVQASSIGWGGYIDLLSISDSRCEISDIKTGEAKESHTDQIRLYALFWWLDNELNPEGRLADTLRLRYPSETIEVSAPNEAELKNLRQQITQRGEAVRALISEVPPPARPEKERCNRCDVRHLCEKYWSNETQAQLTDDCTPDYVDVELRLTHSSGPNMWRAQILSNGHWQRGEEAIFEAEKGGVRLQNLDEIRILGAQVVDEPRSDHVLLRETRYSEVFLLKRL